MKKIYLSLISLSFSLTAFSQSPNWLWAKAGTGNYVEGNAQVATDLSGNVYSAGEFLSPSVVFGTTTLTNSYAGDGDIFIVKYSAAGNVLWAIKGGQKDADGVRDIAVSASNHIYVTGYFADTLSFGTNSVVSSGSGDVFVAKFDSMGTNIWLRKAGGSGFDIGFSIALDNTGNVAVGGLFQSGTFSAGTYSVANAASGADGFAMKLDASGNIVWLNGMSGTEEDICRSVTFDGSGNVYAVGHFYSDVLTVATATLGNASPNLSNSDAYLVKFSPTGAVIMSMSEGGSDSDIFDAVRMNASGEVIVTGVYESNDMAIIGNTNLPSPASSSFFMVSYDATGTPLWVETFAGAAYTTDLEVAANGDIYVVTGGRLRKYNPGGTYSWSLTAEPGSGETVASIDLRLPFIAIGGRFENTSTLGTTTLTSAGYSDVLTGVLYMCQQASLSLTQAGLTANVFGGSYQWYDCIYGTIMPLENNSSFLPQINGSYAVIININGCTDTSACYAYNNVSLKDRTINKTVLAPNPASLSFTASGLLPGEYLLINVLGQPVKMISVVSDVPVNVDVTDLNQGVYFLSNADRKFNKKIIVSR